MTSRIQIRRGTSALWVTSNPTLAQGELGMESDTLKIKIGDGATAWNSLAYVDADGGNSGPTGPVGPVTSVAGRGGDILLSKSDVGLPNVDNTADLLKPISVPVQQALDEKASRNSPIFTGTPQGITKAHVGLANVDNTADLEKPVSGPQAAAIAAAATGVSVTSVAGRTGNVVLTKADVGLDGVDNTSDTTKPVSIPQAAALSLKAPLASPVFTGSPTAPTPTSPTGVANKSYVDTSLTSKVGSDGSVLSLIRITQKAYDELPVKSSTTVYVIID